jgi:hypothetical protein
MTGVAVRTLVDYNEGQTLPSNVAIAFKNVAGHARLSHGPTTARRHTAVTARRRLIRS